MSKVMWAAPNAVALAAASASMPDADRPASSPTAAEPRSADPRLLRCPSQARWTPPTSSTGLQPAIAGQERPSHPSGAARYGDHRSIEAKRRGGWGLVARELGELLLKVAAIAGVAVLVFAFVFGLERVGDVGMDPAVKGGDLVVFYRLGADHRAGDVVVLDKDGVGRQVRRVVAVAGDTVDTTERGLTVNGSALDLGLAEDEPAPPVDPSVFPVTLAPGELFVLGDALGANQDSRVYGAVSLDDVEGEVVVLIRRRGF
jgi:signal peptidase I